MEKKEKIAIKIRSMKKYVDFLRSYQSVAEERLEEDYELKSAIERNFSSCHRICFRYWRNHNLCIRSMQCLQFKSQRGPNFLYNFSIQL